MDRMRANYERPMRQDEMTGNKRKFAVSMTVVMFSMVGLCASGCGLVETEKPLSGSLSEITVNTMRVRREANSGETAIYFGSLKPIRESRLRFARSGTISSIMPLGSRVALGETLAELEQASLEGEIADLEAELEASTNTGPNPQLQARLSELQIQRDQGLMKAPWDCLVVERVLDEGSAVSPEIAPLRVVDTQPPRVVIRLPRRVADRLRMDQSIWAVVGDQAVECQVDYRSVEEVAAGSKTVWLAIQSDLEQIPWAFGQTVEVRFNLTSDRAGYWVPLSSLNQDASGLWSLYVIERRVSGEPLVVDVSPDVETQTAMKKIVSLLQLQNDWALVDGALSDNEMIVVNGTHRVVSGQAVQTSDVTSQLVRPGVEVADE
ncbi:MAG: hypothetical protein GY819_02835 [Planctomycetaceae bacterium]|nr:hypothetical protein [Planctomycetaceae bacterium]